MRWSPRAWSVTSSRRAPPRGRCRSTPGAVPCRCPVALAGPRPSPTASTRRAAPRPGAAPPAPPTPGRPPRPGRTPGTRHARPRSGRSRCRRASSRCRSGPRWAWSRAGPRRRPRRTSWWCRTCRARGRPSSGPSRRWRRRRSAPGRTGRWRARHRRRGSCRRRLGAGPVSANGSAMLEHSGGEKLSVLSLEYCCQSSHPDVHPTVASSRCDGVEPGLAAASRHTVRGEHEPRHGEPATHDDGPWRARRHPPAYDVAVRAVAIAAAAPGPWEWARSRVRDSNAGPGGGRAGRGQTWVGAPFGSSAGREEGAGRSRPRERRALTVPTGAVLEAGDLGDREVGEVVQDDRPALRPRGSPAAPGRARSSSRPAGERSSCSRCRESHVAATRLRRHRLTASRVATWRTQAAGWS